LRPSSASRTEFGGSVRPPESTNRTTRLYAARSESPASLSRSRSNALSDGNERTDGEDLVGSQRFDIRLLDRHDGNRLADGVEHLKNDPRLTAGRVRDPVDEHGHVSLLEVMLIEVAAQGYSGIQIRLHESGPHQTSSSRSLPSGKRARIDSDAPIASTIRARVLILRSSRLSIREILAWPTPARAASSSWEIPSD